MDSGNQCNCRSSRVHFVVFDGVEFSVWLSEITEADDQAANREVVHFLDMRQINCSSESFPSRERH